MKYVLCLLVSMVVQSCTPSADPVGPGLGEEFVLRYGETAEIAGVHLTVRFKSVADDSRCPEGAMCVWQGNAKIVLQIGRQDTTLNTVLPPNEITYGRLNIKLVSVKPYPVLNQPINLEDYFITLVVN